MVLCHLHTKRVIFRDLKPENILLGADGYLRLTDFGLAKQLRWPFRTWTRCGTNEYLSPESFHSDGYSFAVDWWALGVVIFEMSAGVRPFRGDRESIRHKVAKGF